MASDLEGYADLYKKLELLGDPKANTATLKAAVRKPMNDVKKVAQANIAAISPGAADIHKTYKGRLVGAGFAARSLKVVVKTWRNGSSAVASLGVAREAFYAVQFFELGTAAIPKQPWLVPALESSQSATIKGVGMVLKQRIEKIAKKRAAAGGKK